MADLTYYVGRTFDKITTSPDNDWEWGIVLSGNAVIGNKDEERTTPPTGLEGTAFLFPIFSELDTRLQFGIGETIATEVTLTPTKYTIADPVYASGDEEIFPQVPLDPSSALPPDPSGERVVDHPEGGETE